MAEDQATHVIFKGKHYIIPGKHGPEEAFKRVQNLTGAGPKLRPGISTKSGFEDTSAEAQAVLGRNPEPNRARDVLPKLVEFALMYGAIPGLAGLPGKAVGALRGLSAGQRAATAGKAVLKAGAYGAAGMAANEGLQAAGVPRGVSEAVVGAAGLATKPGRAMLKAGAQALAGEAAAVPAAARAASAAPAAVAEAAPAVSAARAEADKIAAQLIRWREGGMSGGQMVSALKKVYGVDPKVAGQMVKETIAAMPSGGAAAAKAASEARQAVSGLQAPRIEVGAEKVGRAVGMTKEQVRRAAGPVLYEELGAASPVLPRSAIKSIADKLRTIPPGPERDAYIALANSEKAMLNIEIARRTLESQGMVLPFATVAGLVIKSQLDQSQAAEQ